MFAVALLSFKSHLSDDFDHRVLFSTMTLTECFLAQTSKPRQTAEHFNITLRALNKHLSFGQIVYFAQTRKLKAPMVEGLLHILHGGD